MRYYLIPIKLTKNLSLAIPNVMKYVEKFSQMANENINCYYHFGEKFYIPSEIENAHFL